MAMQNRRGCLELVTKEKPSHLGYFNHKNGENMKSIIVSMIATAGLTVAGSAMATDMPDLAKKSGCTACHTIEKKLVGPAWRDVSKAYNKVGSTGTAVDPKAYNTTQTVAAILKEHGKATS